MAYLNLTLFGGFEVALSSGACVSLPTKKAQALLAYCALRPGQAHQRGKLATLLWGDTEEENARNSLRQTIFVLRTALGGKLSPALRIDADTVAADPLAIEVDVLNFERLAAERTRQALERAATLYRGDLLEGFVVDEEPFENWLFQERERLKDLAMEVLAQLLRHQDAEGMVEAAAQTARRLLALDPLQEAVHRALMRLHARAGRREAALRQYEVCVGLLRRELRLEPEPETRRLYEEMRKRLRPAFEPLPVGMPDVGGVETAGPGPLEATNARSGAGAGMGSHPHGEERVRPALAVRPSFLEEYGANVLQAQRECEKVRLLREEYVARRVVFRRALEENTQKLRAFRKLVLEGLGSPRSLAADGESGGDSASSYAGVVSD